MKKRYSNHIGLKDRLKNAIFLLIISFVTINCDKKSLPDTPLEKKETNKVIPLDNKWHEKLDKLANKSGENIFEEYLKELNLTDRQAILDILNVITDESQQQAFLEHFVSFDKEEQAELFKILLYLHEKDKVLLDKLIDPNQHLTFSEKLQMWNILRELPEKDQILIQTFKNELDQAQDTSQ